MPEEIFSLKSLSFRFPEDEEKTLTGISFSVERGERLVLTGPSGCGKSTLLYLLNRLYPENCDGLIGGEICLFGKPAADYAPGEINHRIATVFQDPDSQFCMPTVEEELAFTLENLHVPFADMDARIGDVLELTGLADMRHTVIHSLSGGMKQRVATACALIMDPEVLLLDEPLSHLDPYTAKQFVHWLEQLQQNSNLTILAVEHRLDSLFRLSGAALRCRPATSCCSRPHTRGRRRSQARWKPASGIPPQCLQRRPYADSVSC